MKPLIPLVALATALLLPATGLAKDEKSIAKFTKAMIKMAPGIDPVEAQQISELSHRESRRLGKEYKMTGFSTFQSFLVNMGMREKGHCFHFAYDIGKKLREVPLRTMELHWGASKPGTHMEHNVIIVTAIGRPIWEGYIIDGWRNSGRLCWWPVKEDRYPWGEDFKETAWLQAGNPLRPKEVRQAVAVNPSIVPQTVATGTNDNTASQARAESTSPGRKIDPSIFEQSILDN